MTSTVMTSKSRTHLLILFLLAAFLLIGGWSLSAAHDCRDQSLISVSTDKPGYTSSEAVHVTLTNHGDRPVDIYCPSTCSLGNFPTGVERRVDGRWEHSHVFCPSIGSPLEYRGVPEGDYIRHTLPPGDSFDVKLSNLVALRLEKEEQYRIVYYVCGGQEPIYSTEYTLSP
jgi:hypothetical protein